MATTMITIRIEDRDNRTRVIIEGQLKHDFQQLYSAMGYATWAVAGADEDHTRDVNLTAGEWLPSPTFIDD
jgi:hypothetical protein